IWCGRLRELRQAGTMNHMGRDEMISELKGIIRALEDDAREHIERSDPHLENARQLAAKFESNKLEDGSDVRDFLRAYVMPPTDRVDLLVRYETSIDRRLQKSIGTFFAMHAARRSAEDDCVDARPN